MTASFVSSVQAFSTTTTTLTSSSSPLPLRYHHASSASATASASYFRISTRTRKKYSMTLSKSSPRVILEEILLDEKTAQDYDCFDPFHYFKSHDTVGWGNDLRQQQQHLPNGINGESDRSSTTTTTTSSLEMSAPILALSTTTTLSSFSSSCLLLLFHPQPAIAAGAESAIHKLTLSQGDYFNPDSFRPVCSNSDAFYRLLQSSTRSIVGDDNFLEYGPLIAGGLLRIRLELCVVESFFNEAVGPFVRQNGLNWILPWHESVETFLAGTIFALATTFILVGSTKLIQILAFYGDLIVGGPCRLLGGFFFDRARGEPVTLDVSFFGFFRTRLVGPPVDFEEEEEKKKKKKNSWGDEGKVPLLDLEKVKPMDVPLLALSGSVKLVGEASKIFREFIEALDLFVGRYLVLIASGYIILKVLHFKVFPDFP